MTMSFVSELRRRQVFRTAALYSGLAWLAIEVANTVFPQFGLPGWSVRAVIVTAVLGLPVALLLAWSFDLSAAGLRREVIDPAQVPAITPARLWRVPSLWIALVLGAGLALSAQQAWQRLVRPTFDERPSLAVLPFANLSPDPENAYFADGLHEEILTGLARAGQLRVISRTSVQEYREAKRNMRDIADALDASLILEGSVRRVGDDVRLTLQLIDGRTDEHLWAETYDRKYQDALQLQRTVAQRVVQAIGARLNPTEQRLIAGAAPAVAAAHEPYLRALALWDQYGSLEQFGVMESLLGESIAHDPGFALAYALRAKVRIWMTQTFDPPDEANVLAQARADIDRALALVPDLPEALTARGLYQTYVDRNPERGLADLERALSIAPNDPDAQNVAGLTLRRLGRFDEAVERFREAARLTPRQDTYIARYLETLVRLGRYTEAEAVSQEFAERFPGHMWSQFTEYVLRYLQTGSTEGWQDEYERLAPTLSRIDRTNQGMLVSLAAGDLRVVASLLETGELEDDAERRYYLALVYAALDDARVRPLLEELVDLSAQSGDDPYALAQGAVALSLLGDHGRALRLVDEAARLAPESRDAINGRLIAADRAWVLIRSGSRSEEGYAELERLVGGFDTQPRRLAASLPWLLLRDDPRTKQILRDTFPELGDKTAGG